MNRERARELLPIIRAYAEGKDVQLGSGKNEDGSVLWLDIPDPCWDGHGEYRIKPEPREFKLVIGKETGEIFKFDKDLPLTGYEIIKVREILDDE